MDKILEQMKQLKEAGGIDANTIEAQANEYKEFKAKENANEVMHTTNTGYGAELIPTDQLTTDVLEMIPQFATFFNNLPGFHGNNMGQSVSKPIVGEIGYATGLPERTSNALAYAQANRKLPTAKVTITQKTLYAQVDVSMQELLYSIVDLEALVKKQLAKSFSKTIESAILNADPTDTATGNINLDDAQPSATFPDGDQDHRLIYATSLRKTMLDGTVDVDYKDIGVLSWANLIETRGLLGEWSFDLEDILLLMNSHTYTKALTITEFKDASQNGKTSTIATGAIDKISGNDMYVPRSYPKTEADGKVSGTPANNTKGGFMYMKRQAVQYGYGMPLEMEVHKILGQGIAILAAMEMWFTIVNKKAGVTDPWVVGGINVTL